MSQNVMWIPNIAFNTISTSYCCCCCCSMFLDQSDKDRYAFPQPIGDSDDDEVKTANTLLHSGNFSCDYMAVTYHCDRK